MLPALAIILLGLALWVNLVGGAPEYRPATLSAAELAALKPDLDGDVRLLEELQRRGGSEPGDWRGLGEGERALFATLWAEAVQRTTTWAGRAVQGEHGDGVPTLEEIAAAYHQLGDDDAAAAMRALARPYAEALAANRAWIAQLQQGGKPGPRPALRELEAAAAAAFARAARVRAPRLAYVRDHAAELGIR